MTERYRMMLLAGPPVEPLTLAEAKSYLRETGDEQDAVLERLIRTAREMAEQQTGRALITQRWQLVGDASLSRLYLPRWPLQAVEGLTVDGQPVTAYRATLGDGPLLKLDTPLWGDWQLTLRCGYGDTAESVPQTLRDWIGLMVNTLYENREAITTGTIVSSFPYVEQMLDPYRITL
jgi:uncharacterized phiE125 gp8 family phage protein